jgi:hypothetical protein
MTDISTLREQLLGVVEQARHRFAGTTQAPTQNKGPSKKRQSTKHGRKAKKSKRPV